MDLPMLLLSGAVAGTLAGLLGIGGGIIIVPIVTLLFEIQGLFAVFLFVLAGRMSFNLL